jgi:hypothetical protein
MLALSALCWRCFQSIANRKPVAIVTIGLVSLCQTGKLDAAEGLRPLAYNNPGLVVDLGVGLWAWPIPCDADGDGDFDLIVSCPDKPSNGIWLFENKSGDTASEPMPVFEPARRLSDAVHYVMPSYDDDGQLSVLTPGFEHPNFRLTGLREKTPLPLDTEFYSPRWPTQKGPRVRHKQWRYADFNGDGQRDLIIGIEDWSEYGWDDAYDAKGNWTRGPLHGFVFVCINRNTNAEPAFDPPQHVLADGEPIDVYGCPSPNFHDFDGDGDLDLICGEFLDSFTYFENTGTRQSPHYQAGQQIRDSAGEIVRMNLQMIVPVAFDWDRDGDADLIVGDEDGRVAFVEHTGRIGPDGIPQFSPPKYFQQRADKLKCGALATPDATDWDGDGDFDIVSGNTSGTIEWFENLSGPGVAEPRWDRPKKITVDGEPFRVTAGDNGSIQGPAEAKWGYTTLCVADWDQDGFSDIVFNSIWGRIEWLRNTGSPGKPQMSGPFSIEVAWPAETTPPKPAWTWWTAAGNQLVTQWRTTPTVFDWDKDGLPDLVMLDHEGYLALYRRSMEGGQLRLLPPERIFAVAGSSKPLRLNSGDAGKSGRRKICLVDWDRDGQTDLLVNSTSANFLRQTSQSDGRYLFQDLGPIVEQNIQGHSTSPTTVDFDADGIPEFLGGAEDGRFYYLPRDGASEQAVER